MIPDPLPLVVFVHGVRSSSAIWDRQVAHVTSLGYEATAVDLPGHGERRRERFTLEGAFAVIDDAAAAGAGRGVVVVGLSLGGYASLAWAARRPAHLRGVVASSCTSEPKGKPVAAFRASAAAIVAGRDAVARWGRLAAYATRGTLAPHRRSVPVLEGTGTPAERPHWNVVTDVLGEVAGRSWLALARSVEAPVWLVNGARDQMRLDERRFQRATRGRLVVIPGAGHDVHLDAPDAFNAALGRALVAFSAGAAAS